MNTKLIQQTKPIHLPHFPELNGKDRIKVITKHFANLSLWCSADELRMITWLIYQSKVDNTIIYNTLLLTRYSAAIKAANKQYKGIKVNYNVKHLRVVFKRLIEQGLMLSSGGKVYMVNPMLAYRTEYMKPNNYSYICGIYQHWSDNIGDTMFTAEFFTREYIKIVNSYLEKK